MTDWRFGVGPAGRRRIQPADLQGEKFVAFEEIIPTRRGIDRLLKASRVKVNVAMEFSNTELIKRAISVDAGVGILPLENVEREAQRGELCYARFRDRDRWSRPVAILRRRGKASSPAEKIFLSILKSRT